MMPGVKKVAEKTNHKTLQALPKREGDKTSMSGPKKVSLTPQNVAAL